MRSIPSDTPVTGENLQIHYAEQWAALYRDGELVTVGDTYVAEEQAFELLGVTRVHDDAFMRGQTSRGGVAQTLDEVRDYANDRAANIARAAILREDAARLLAEADRISGR